MQRKDAFLFELQNTMKETRDNIEKLTELLVSNSMEEIVSVVALDALSFVSILRLFLFLFFSF